MSTRVDRMARLKNVQLRDWKQKCLVSLEPAQIGYSSTSSHFFPELRRQPEALDDLECVLWVVSVPSDELLPSVFKPFGPYLAARIKVDWWCEPLGEKPADPGAELMNVYPPPATNWIWSAAQRTPAKYAYNKAVRSAMQRRDYYRKKGMTRSVWTDRDCWQAVRMVAGSLEEENARTDFFPYLDGSREIGDAVEFPPPGSSASTEVFRTWRSKLGSNQMRDIRHLKPGIGEQLDALAERASECPVFLSYRGKGSSAEIAPKIARDLAADGIPVWFDRVALHFGEGDPGVEDQAILKLLQRAIEAAAVFVVVGGDEPHFTDWTRRELDCLSTCPPGTIAWLSVGTTKGVAAPGNIGTRLRDSDSSPAGDNVVKKVKVLRQKVSEARARCRRTL